MKLPANIWNSKAIRNRLFAEASFECAHGMPSKFHYWVVVPEGDTMRGQIVLKNYTASPLSIDPHEMQQEFARQVREVLQKELHHDGVWVVGWTHPPEAWEAVRIDGDNVWGRLIMIWLDEDADPQYTVESDLPFLAMVEAGIENYLGQAARAHEAWSKEYGKKAMKEDFGIKANQTTKEALATLH